MVGNRRGSRSGGGRGVALVADNHEHIVRLLQMALGQAGYRVLSAGSGEEALRLARAHRPDVALLDISMPDGTGIEVCRAMRDDPDLRGVPVLLVTSSTREQDRRAAVDAGAAGYVVKP